MFAGVIRKLAPYGPIFFGIGFVAPVVAQAMDTASLSAPGGLTTLQFGLIVGLTTGTIAKLRGRWI